MLRQYVCIGLVLALCASAWRDCCGADESPVAAAAARSIGPFLDDDAFGLLRVDMAKIEAQPLYVALAQLARLKLYRSFPSQDELEDYLTRYRAAGGRDAFVVLSSQSMQGTPTIIFTWAKGSDAAMIEAILASGRLKSHLGWERVERIHNAVCAGTQAEIERLKTVNAAERPALAPALAATIGSTQQLLLLPTEDQRRVAEQFVLPEAFGPASVPLARSLSWASLGLDWPPQSKLEIVIEASDAAGVERVRAAIPAALDRLEKLPQLREYAPQLAGLRKVLDWKTSDTRLSLTIDDRQGKLTTIAREVIQPSLDTVALEKNRNEAIEQLLHLGVAMHNYHDKNKSFPPPAIRDKEGKPLLSWRVAILPYLEGMDETKLPFRLDEAWDSPHNKQFIARMPEVFRSPLSKVSEAGETVYMAPIGEGTIFDSPNGVRIRDVVDGTSLTILLVVADDRHAVPWTKPEEWTFDPQHPQANLAESFPGRLLFLFADGSVHNFRKTIADDTLELLFRRNDRTPVRIPDD